MHPRPSSSATQPLLRRSRALPVQACLDLQEKASKQRRVRRDAPRTSGAGGSTPTRRDPAGILLRRGTIELFQLYKEPVEWSEGAALPAQPPVDYTMRTIKPLVG